MQLIKYIEDKNKKLINKLVFVLLRIKIFERIIEYSAGRSIAFCLSQKEESPGNTGHHVS